MKKAHWSLVFVLLCTFVWAGIRNTRDFRASGQSAQKNPRPFAGMLITEPLFLLEEPDRLRCKVILLD